MQETGNNLHGYRVRQAAIVLLLLIAVRIAPWALLTPSPATGLLQARFVDGNLWHADVWHALDIVPLDPALRALGTAI